MNRTRSILLAVCLVWILPGTGASAQPVDQLIEEASSYEFGQPRRSLTAIERMIADTASDPTKREAIARSLAAALTSDGTTHAKRFFCRQLAIVGDARSVPALAQALRNPSLVDVATDALARIEAPEARKALRDALPDLRGRALLGVIRALAFHPDAAAFVPIARLGRDAGPELRSAVIRALGRIADEPAADMLGSLLTSDTSLDDEAFVEAVIDAALLCAEHRLAEGDDAAAARLYSMVMENAPETHQRMAGIRGTVRLMGPGASVIVSSLLDEPSPWPQFAARLVRESPNPDLAASLAKSLPALREQVKPILIDALAARGDPAVAPAIAAMMSSGNDAVRASAIRAVATLGGPRSARALVRHYLRNEQDRPIVEHALRRVRDPNAGKTIASALTIADEPTRLVLLAILADRRAVEAADVVLDLARETEGRVRDASLAALARIAAPDQIPALADFAAAHAEDEEAVARILANLILRHGRDDRLTAEAIDRFDRTPGVLLLALPEIAGERALTWIRSALSDPALRSQAVASLARWPDAAPISDLLEIAASDDPLRVTAFAAASRLATLAGNAAPLHFTRLTRLIQTDDDAETLLNHLQAAPSTATLAIAIDRLARQGVGEAARDAVLVIAERLDRTHRLDALAGVEAVRTSTDDARVLMRCNEVQNFIERDLDYLTAWLVSGPYTRKGIAPIRLLDTPFAPEDGSTAVNWRELRVTNSSMPGRFDLASTLGGDNRCAYVKCDLWVPTIQPVRLELASDDGIKAWLNGRLIHENNRMRGLTLGEDVVEVTLRKGWNTLMLKISQGGGSWEFACRIRTPEGLGVPSLIALPHKNFGTPSPDARVLFDGRDTGAWMHLDGRDCQWPVAAGTMTVRPGSGSIISRAPIEDGLLYVEFSTSRHPASVRGQARGNSGVYLQGRYEVQVLDSWGEPPAPNRCGAIYGKRAPDASVCARPGQWQNYLIDFTAPRWEGTEKSSNARMTVWHNGVRVHDDIEVDTSTGAGRPERAEPAGLLLQDHGCPVRYGRIWYLPDSATWEGPDAPGFTSLFDGRTLAGWERRGGIADFRVEDGAIVGRTRPNTPNTFLCTTRTFGDFVLELEFKIDDELNSGIQIRSNSDPAYQNGRVHGYQVEIDPSARAWTAGIYDEGRRGWLHDLSHNERARNAFRHGAWNRLRIVCEGPLIRTYLNGVPAAVLADDMTRRGFIALQVHGVGPRAEPLEVRWRDIRIRELDEPASDRSATTSRTRRPFE